MNNISQQLREARKASGLTQEQVAERMGTGQGSIARLENPAYAGHTISTVTRFAQAVGCRLHIDVVARIEELDTACKVCYT